MQRYYYFKLVTYPDKNYPTVGTELKYILRGAAATHSGHYGVIHGDIEYITQQFEYVKYIWNKRIGKQVEHFIISFNVTSKISVEEAVVIADNIAYLYGKKYQIVYAIHEDTDFLHIHFIMNTISYITGERYNCDYSEFAKLEERVGFECLRIIKF